MPVVGPPMPGPLGDPLEPLPIAPDPGEVGLVYTPWPDAPLPLVELPLALAGPQSALATALPAEDRFCASRVFAAAARVSAPTVGPDADPVPAAGGQSTAAPAADVPAVPDAPLPVPDDPAAAPGGVCGATGLSVA